MGGDVEGKIINVEQWGDASWQRMGRQAGKVYTMYTKQFIGGGVSSP